MCQAVYPDSLDWVADLDKLDDPDYPAYTIGQVAEMLGVQQAFLRSLDTANVVSPGRSGGGHRRYSRRQLAVIVRLRELFDQGHTLAASAHILGLEDQLVAANDTITDLREQLAQRDDRSGEDAADG